MNHSAFQSHWSRSVGPPRSHVQLTHLCVGTTHICVRAAHVSMLASIPSCECVFHTGIFEPLCSRYDNCELRCFQFWFISHYSFWNFAYFLVMSVGCSTFEICSFASWNEFSNSMLFINLMPAIWWSPPWVIWLIFSHTYPIVIQFQCFSVCHVHFFR